MQQDIWWSTYILCALLGVQMTSYTVDASAEVLGACMPWIVATNVFSYTVNVNFVFDSKTEKADNFIKLLWVVFINYSTQ